MAKFTTRVELHSAKVWSDYDTLHTAMAKQGFTRTITFGNTKYHLPSAEYNREAELTPGQVRDSAKVAAESTGHTFSILVTESNGRASWNLEEA